MKRLEVVKNALHICVNGTAVDCKNCPYFDGNDDLVCVTALKRDALEHIHKLETMQTQPKHGEWIKTGEYMHCCEIIRCPFCGDIEIDANVEMAGYHPNTDMRLNYCPNCGARLSYETL